MYFIILKYLTYVYIAFLLKEKNIRPHNIINWTNFHSFSPHRNNYI